MASPVATVKKDRRVSSRALIASVIGDAQRLVALEVALARQEMKELATGNAIGAGLMAFGGLLVLLAVLVAVPSLVVILVPGTGRRRRCGSVPTWWPARSCCSSAGRAFGSASRRGRSKA